MTKIPLYVYWIATLILGFVGEIFSKRWGIDQTWFNAIIILLAYEPITLCWLGIMAHTNKLVIMTTLWSLVGTLLTVIVGVIMYGEQPSPTNWVGFGLAVVAGILLTR